MQLEISNEQNIVEVTPELAGYLERAAALTIELTGGQPDSELSIILVDDSYIRELNKSYREMDCATDVLSFSMQEHTADEPQVLGLEEDNILGDVFVSMETAQRQCEEYGHSLNREVVFLAVHGVLHLLGYDHLEEGDRVRMREKEEEVMNQLDLRRGEK